MQLSETSRPLVARLWLRARAAADSAEAALAAAFANRPAARAGLACLLVAIAWGLAAIQWPLRDLVVPWDSKNQFYAFFRFMAAAIHDGSTPFWNPYHYAGHPSIADPQSLIFSPAFFLWALVDPRPSMFAFDAMVFAHLLAGGIAVVFYGRKHGWSVAGSVLAAIVFMLGGSASSRLTHVGIITAYALFPIALLWMEVALERRSFLAATGFGGASAMIALGRSQEPLLLVFALSGLTIHHLASRARAPRYLWSRLPIIAAAGGVSIAIVAIPLLLTMQFANFSNRPEIDIDLALRSSLYPLNLANFLVPDIFGSLQPLRTGNWGPGYFTRPDVDSTDRAFNYLFAGSLPALLLIWHGVIGGRMFAGGARMFAALGALAVFYAFGRYTPLFPYLFAHLPGVDLFRRPVDATFIFDIGLAFLCGSLATRYAREGIPRCPRPVLALGIIGVAALLAWSLVFSAASSNGWAAALQIATSAPIYLGLALLLVLPKSQRMRSIAAAIAVAFTAGELVVHNAASPLNGEPRAYYAMLEAPTGEAARVLDAIKRDWGTHAEPGVRPRVEIVGLSGPWQNAAMVLGLEATNGYNPLRIGPYDRLVSPGESSFATSQRTFPVSFPAYDCLLGQMLGLRYVVLDRPIEALPHLARRSSAEAIMTGPTAWIYRLANAAPRVTLESRVRIADADEFIDAGRFPQAMAPREVMVDSDDDLSQKYPASALANPGKAEITNWRPDKVEIKVEAAGPAILTLRDPWYPGWEVEVDGAARPLLRTDILFRGVEVPAGAHRVVFAFRPLSAQNLWAAATGLFGDAD